MSYRVRSRLNMSYHTLLMVFERGRWTLQLELLIRELCRRYKLPESMLS